MDRVSQEIGEFYHHYPRPATVITAHAQGRDNAMAAAWHAPLSRKPPLFGVSISPNRFTYKLILESGEFGVNFLPFDKAELIASVGGSKGEEVDKFRAFQIAVVRPLMTSVPILKDAYAAYECRLTDHRSYGDHEWLVGEVVAVHLREEAFTEAEVLDVGRVSPALYLGAELYLTASGQVRHLDRETYGRR